MTLSDLKWRTQGAWFFWQISYLWTNSIQIRYGNLHGEVSINKGSGTPVPRDGALLSIFGYPTYVYTL